MGFFARLALDEQEPVSSPEVRFIYVIGELGRDEPVKVGRARQPIWRLQDLQSGNPRRLELRACWRVERFLAHFVEKRIHEQLADVVTRGEWFDASTAHVIALIERIGVANA